MAMDKPGAFIFDIDGTLVDSMAAHTQAWLEFLAKQGARLDSPDARRLLVGRTTRDILIQVFGDGLSDAEIEDLTEQKESLYRQLYLPKLVPLPGLLDFLERSRLLGIPLAVASSAHKPNIDYTLDGLGIRGYFKEIIGEGQVEHPKPDPEIYLVTAARLGVPPSRCIVFEDSAVGIRAALGAGARVIGVATTLEAEALRRDFPLQAVIQDYTEVEAERLLASFEK
jgi:HAD superfamily hydrolase (TIGR01509 family)